MKENFCSIYYSLLLFLPNNFFPLEILNNYLKENKSINSINEKLPIYFEITGENKINIHDKCFEVLKDIYNNNELLFDEVKEKNDEEIEKNEEEKEKIKEIYCEILEYCLDDESLDLHDIVKIYRTFKKRFQKNTFIADTFTKKINTKIFNILQKVREKKYLKLANMNKLTFKIYYDYILTIKYLIELLEKNNNFLENQELELGIIYNSLGHIYLEIYQHFESSRYLRQSIKIFMKFFDIIEINKDEFTLVNKKNIDENNYVRGLKVFAFALNNLSCVLMHLKHIKEINLIEELVSKCKFLSKKISSVKYDHLYKLKIISSIIRKKFFKTNAIEIFRLELSFLNLDFINENYKQAYERFKDFKVKIKNINIENESESFKKDFTSLKNEIILVSLRFYLSFGIKHEDFDQDFKSIIKENKILFNKWEFLFLKLKYFNLISNRNKFDEFQILDLIKNLTINFHNDYQLIKNLSYQNIDIFNCQIKLHLLDTIIFWGEDNFKIFLNQSNINITKIKLENEINVLFKIIFPESLDSESKRMLNYFNINVQLKNHLKSFENIMFLEELNNEKIKCVKNLIKEFEITKNNYVLYHSNNEKVKEMENNIKSSNEIPFDYSQEISYYKIFARFYLLKIILELKLEKNKHKEEFINKTKVYCEEIVSFYESIEMTKSFNLIEVYLIQAKLYLISQNFNYSFVLCLKTYDDLKIYFNLNQHYLYAVIYYVMQINIVHKNDLIEKLPEDLKNINLFEQSENIIEEMLGKNHIAYKEMIFFKDYFAI